MKKILFIGNANSFLIIQLAKKLIAYNPDLQIDILSDQTIKSECSPFHHSYCVDDSNPKANKKIIKAFYLAVQMKKLIQKVEGKYDVIHILYVSASYRYFWNDLKLTVFGGDFYKSKWYMNLLIAKMAKESSLISATNPSTLKAFCTKFNVSSNNNRLVRFGLNILDEIDAVSHSDILNWKQRNGILPSEIILACGYNGSMNQNLLKIIESLKNVKSSLSSVVLTLQLYENTAHVDQVITYLKESGLKFLLIRERLSDRELAVYRSSVDIMIQVQTTDSFSGAMQEHLYAGSTVITGSWLPYAVLDEKNITYIKVNEISEVGKEVCANLTNSLDKSMNKEIIAKLSKWSNTIPDWSVLYL
jgi:hypothetical protein